MSSSKIRFGLPALLLAASLSACGFTPLASLEDKNGQSGYSVTKLSIAAPDKSFEYDMRKYLDQRVLITSEADVSLSLTVATESERVAVKQNDTITRNNLTAKADYKLLNAENEVVRKGVLVSTTAINATADFLATRTSRQEARRLLARDLGRQLMSILYSYRLSTGS